MIQPQTTIIMITMIVIIIMVMIMIIIIVIVMIILITIIYNAITRRAQSGAPKHRPRCGSATARRDAARVQGVYVCMCIYIYIYTYR